MEEGPLLPPVDMVSVEMLDKDAALSRASIHGLAAVSPGTTVH